GEGVLSVENAIRVALLGEEALAVCGEVGVHRVPGDYGVEPCGRALRLGPEQAPQPLRLFLSGPEGPGHLDRYLRGRQVNREVGDLADDEQLHLALPEGLVEPL